MSRVPHRTLSALLALALAIPGITAVPAAAGRLPGPPPGLVALDHPVSGEAAIAALGPSISTVASAHGKTVSELARALRDDRGLTVDRRGRLFYLEGALPVVGQADSAAASAPAVAAPYPLGDTFKLHSLPGSKRTLYLDFDGHVLTGCVWNSDKGGASIIAPAWDIEGGTTVFTDAERRRIQAVWQSVAEDYAPFDIDVTTELASEDRITRSSSQDDVYGMRALISPISSYFGGYGGIAYIGVFDSVGDYYKPALIFSDMLSNGEKYMAEAISHESGHTLGLLHDGTTTGVSYYPGHGTGETGWAPIMGNGYYKALTQWSKGEYPNANNAEDDFATIQNNGGPLRADDYGDTMATASRLPSSAQLSASGFVGRTGDVDALAFSTGAGQVAFSVAPGAYSPDVDLLLELRDPTGALLASGNLTDSLSASVSATVPGGTYYLFVKGTGRGDLATGYSDYASLGAWTATGVVVDPGSTPVAPIATAVASASSGEAPLPVLFDGSGSYDPDGSVSGFWWDFGDGTSAEGSTASHVYLSPGDYRAVLTVTDSTGLNASSAVTVSVASPNSAPVAHISASATTGQAPFAVTFDGGGSSDVDGTVVSWSWQFGDGASASAAVVSHTYRSPGSYIARLAVTDDRGATSTSAVSVQVQQAPVIVMRVSSIQLSLATIGAGREATARVRVTDLSGRPVVGASVSGVWGGAVTGAATRITDGTGTVVLKSKRFRQGTAVFTVSTISKPGYYYDRSKNVVTSASIAASLPVTRYLR